MFLLLSVVTLRLVCSHQSGGLQVKQLWTGERVNVIPGESKALIAGGQEVADKVAAYAERLGFPTRRR